MRLLFASLLVLLVLCGAILADAHPGKTDRYGGHKCYKECAEWDLYYAEYHLHDKNGRPVNVAKKKPAKAGPATAVAEKEAVVEQQKPHEPAAVAPPVVQAATTPDEPDLTLPWVLLALLLLLLVVRRHRKERTAL